VRENYHNAKHEQFLGLKKEAVEIAEQGIKSGETGDICSRCPVSDRFWHSSVVRKQSGYPQRAPLRGRMGLRSYRRSRRKLREFLREFSLADEIISKTTANPKI
jgi:hypothetical protein